MREIRIVLTDNVEIDHIEWEGFKDGWDVYPILYAASHKMYLNLREEREKEKEGKVNGQDKQQTLGYADNDNNQKCG